MKRVIFILAVVLISAICSFGQKESSSGLEILPIENEPMDITLSEIPWIVNDLNSFYKTEALFSISSANSETAAKGWVSVNKEAINIRVVVSDDYHINTRSASMIYDGDSIK